MSESLDTSSLTQRRHRLSAVKQKLLKKLSGGEGGSRTGISRRDDPVHAVASFPQQRLWFLEQMMPGSSIYNMHDAARIRGNMSTDRMRQVLETVVARHEVLRTTFILRDGVPIQFVAPADRPFELPIDDLRDLPEADRWREAERLAIEETCRPFDLERGPLFRARVIRVADDDALLIWTMHHAVSDGWSLGVLIKEVLALSIAYANGDPDPLPPLSIQYGDYAEWQKRWLEEALLQSQLDYWRQELGGDIPAVELPSDRPRPVFPSYEGGRVVRVYPVRLREALKNLAANEGATLFMVMLAAFDVLLNRYTGQDLIYVGTPVANRSRPELEDLIGFFVNTLVLKADFQKNPTFIELLSQVRRTALAAFQHQDIPFERLVEDLQPQRETNRPPFFQVMFVLQNEPMPEASLPGLQITPYDIHNGTSKFDILLNVFEEPEGLNVRIEYSSDLFDQETVERMLDHYLVLLEDIVAHPGRQVSELEVMSGQELRQVIDSFNDTERDYSAYRPYLLHRLVERQVAKSPDAIALRFNGISLTYAELNARANRVARQIRARCTGDNPVIGMFGERSIELVIGLLAILKAGGAYLPLDKDYPEDRLAFMLDDSRAEMVLHQGKAPAWLSHHGKDRLVQLSADDEVEPHDRENLPDHVGEADLAYVIYTSGSTGKPKGAGNSHAAICNRLLWMQDAYDLSAADRVMQKTPFSFDVSVWELFWPLMTGATLVVAPPGAHRDSSWLSELIQQEGITVTHFVPSMLSIFLADPDSPGCTSLRAVMCSGEALTTELVGDFRRKFQADLHNLYGPTEAAVDVTAWDCRLPYARNIVPIGKPIANIRIYILDRYMHPVPIGVPGELYIGGVGVGTGYLFRDELTRERFLSDPLHPGGRLYRTGDLARFDADGVIEYMGRIDQQVKIRGLRIELGEVEHALMRDEAVSNAVVMVREDRPGDQRLVGYLVIREEESGDVRQEDDAVDEWRMVFDEAYTEAEVSVETASQARENVRSGGTVPNDGASCEGGDADFSGWVSSYTGEPIPLVEMREWVDVTVQRLRALKPRRILEIGCGTGLLLEQLMGDCERYVGTDISSAAFQEIRDKVASAGIRQGRIALHRMAAHELERLDESGFDLIIMNSVVQYFPSVDYLLRVLSACRQKLAPGGSIFLGDLRNKALLNAFAVSVAVYQANDNDDVRTIGDRARLALDQERELALDPRFFEWLMASEHGLPEAWVWMRRGVYGTEMCRYRYDAILRAESSVRDMPSETRAWNGGDDLRSLVSEAEQGLSGPVLITGIPNARVVKDCLMADLLEFSERQGAGRSELLASVEDRIRRSVPALDPEEACRRLQPHCRVLIRWHSEAHIRKDDDLSNAVGPEGQFDMLLTPADWSLESAAAAMPVQVLPSATGAQAYANQPGLRARQARIERRLAEALSVSLPDYMCPSAYVFLDSMPLLPNGKTDRKALPAPDRLLQMQEKAYVAPRTTLQRDMADVWAEILGVGRVGIEDDFFALGGHSLLAAQMVLKLRERTGRDIPLRYLFLAPTIAGMADLLEHGDAAGEEADETWAAMQRDATLPAGIQASGNVVPSRRAGCVLLTGATGFLGIFMLRELIARTEYRVLCIVRAQDEEGGLLRLSETWKRYGLPGELDQNRIEVVVGDLSLPMLGVGAAMYRELSEKLDAIYHCAAQVNFVLTYDQMRKANVEGTRELICLASAHHVKRLHFVSTIYTLTRADADDAGILDEHCSARHGETLRMGYLQTKWVAERMAEAARHRGIPVSIYRPGRVAGDSLGGACQRDDFYWGLVRVCLLLASIPDTGFDEILTPVDHVSAAVVALSLQDDLANRNWHPISAEIVTGEALVAAIRRAGFRLEVVPYAVWRDRAIRLLKDRPDDPGARLAGFLFQDSQAVVEESAVNSDITRDMAAKLDVALMGADSEMLDRYVGYFIASGFFPTVNQQMQSEDLCVEEGGDERDSGGHELH